jgi:hypothetical protein
MCAEKGVKLVRRHHYQSAIHELFQTVPPFMEEEK